MFGEFDSNLLYGILFFGLPIFTGLSSSILGFKVRKDVLVNMQANYKQQYQAQPHYVPNGYEQPNYEQFPLPVYEESFKK